MTHDSLLTKGIHKFKRLKDVPPQYLLNIFNSNDKSDIDLYDYISENLEEIKSKLGKPQEEKRRCVKRAFTEEAANKEIKSSRFNFEKYFCHNCGFYHLTTK